MISLMNPVGDSIVEVLEGPFGKIIQVPLYITNPWNLTTEGRLASGVGKERRRCLRPSIKFLHPTVLEGHWAPGC